MLYGNCVGHSYERFPECDEGEGEDEGDEEKL